MTEVAKQGLKAKYRKEPDWSARHKFWRDLSQMTGYLKEANGATVNQLIVNSGVRQLDAGSIEGIVAGIRARLGGEKPVLDNSGRAIEHQDKGGDIDTAEIKQGAKASVGDNSADVGREQAHSDSGT